MLEAIADFWKPVKRLQTSARLKPEELQIGSTIGFGFVPQPTLSGRRFTVTAINTYVFGPDMLTSFVLTQEKDVGASMIVAESAGEPYLALSRRLSISDRNKLFKHEDIEAVIANDAVLAIHGQEIMPEYRGWVVQDYKRELHGVRGQLRKGDCRGGLNPAQAALDFSYILLISDNHEHALEIEKYDDGRVEVYATVYRRLTDVGEVFHPEIKETARPEVKLVSNGAAGASTPLAAKPEPKLEAAPVVPAVETAKPADVQEHAHTTPMTLPEFPAENVAPKTVPLAEPVVTAAVVASVAPVAASSGSVIVQPHPQPYTQQEIKAVNKETSSFVNESIDCELQVANKIIDEAIRSEMRINDVVRKVIGLPVAQQESVQIPVTLTDQDYALLAIRYGIAASDHNAIKRRIAEDLSDFSGANKKKAA